jgi:5-formaminoimidazole-4-carboxamide-1-beta-D-ribofuranosyl 5'-monophosphate synthetase
MTRENIMANFRIMQVQENLQYVTYGKIAFTVKESLRETVFRDQERKRKKENMTGE